MKSSFDDEKTLHRLPEVADWIIVISVSYSEDIVAMAVRRSFVFRMLREIIISPDYAALFVDPAKYVRQLYLMLHNCLEPYFCRMLLEVPTQSVECLCRRI